jgi:hypothetical protein
VTSALAEIDVLGAEGAVSIPGLGATQLSAGVVQDIPLAGLPPGEYVVVVRSDEPVTGSIWWSRATGEILDDVWIEAVSANTEASAAIPANSRATLVIAAQLGEMNPVEVNVSGVHSATFNLNPGVTHSLELPSSAVGQVTVQSTAPVVWSMLLSAAHDPGLVSAVTPVHTAIGNNGSVTVREVLVH